MGLVCVCYVCVLCVCDVCGVCMLCVCVMCVFCVCVSWCVEERCLQVISHCWCLVHMYSRQDINVNVGELVCIQGLVFLMHCVFEC